MHIIPSEDEDPIMRLYAHYFCPSDLMYRHYENLNSEYDRKSKLSAEKSVNMLSYMYFWLSSLCVVYEGFTAKEIQNSLMPLNDLNPVIKMHCTSINHQHGQIGKELKRFRNATFHFQTSASKHVEFLRAGEGRDPMNWARSFHNEFRMLFKKYQIERTVYYMFQTDSVNVQTNATRK